MISRLTKAHLPAVAQAQLLAWQKAFKGILSDDLLAALALEDFIQGWESILLQTARTNFTWLHEGKQPIGFISFGKPKAADEAAEYEIYGIYLHPEFWGKGFGYQLMNHALQVIQQHHAKASVILWTMSENQISRRFYQGYGCKATGKTRNSARNGEPFEEMQYEIQTGNPI